MLWLLAILGGDHRCGSRDHSDNWRLLIRSGVLRSHRSSQSSSAAEGYVSRVCLAGGRPDRSFALRRRRERQALKELRRLSELQADAKAFYLDGRWSGSFDPRLRVGFET
jgi:hypothetical protein